MFRLTKNEEMLLLSIYRLGEKAFGVRIMEYLTRIIGETWNYGTMYTTLDQLVRKGLLERQDGEPIPDRRGRRRVYYRLTPDGIEALKTADTIHRHLWEGISGRIQDEGGLL